MPLMKWPILAGAAFGDGEVTVTSQRFDFQEDFRHSVAHILVVVDLTMPGDVPHLRHSVETQTRENVDEEPWSPEHCRTFQM